jgi:hypothetical protein
MAGVTLVSANPQPGSTVNANPHIDPPGGVQGRTLGFTAQLALTLVITSDKDVGAPSISVQLLGPSGKECARPRELVPGHVFKANQPHSVTAGAEFDWNPQNLPDCPLPTTTSTLRVSIAEPCLFCQGPEFAAKLPLRFTFVSWTPPGSRYPACGAPGVGFADFDPPVFDQTGVCGDGKNTFSPDLSTACRLDGGLFCVNCPGSLCPYPLP